MIEINQPKNLFPTVNWELQSISHYSTNRAGYAYFATSKIGQPSRTAPCAKCCQIDACRCHTGGLAVSVVLESNC